MNQFNVTGLAPRVGTGAVQQGVKSAASDGFKNLFSKLSAEPEPEVQVEAEDTGLEEELLETGDDTVELQEELTENDADVEEPVDEHDLEFEDQEGADEEGPDLDEIVDKLESSEELTDEEVDVLVDEVKELLKDPEVAAKVRDILERAGLDLTNLSETELRNALEALPAGLRDELVEVLSTEELTLPVDTVAQVLSEAIGQLKQEVREAQPTEAPPERGMTREDRFARRLDRFLSRADARVDKADEQANRLLDGQTKKPLKAGQVLQLLASKGGEVPPSTQPNGSTPALDPAVQTVAPQVQVAAKAAAPAPAGADAPVQGTTGPEGKASKTKNLALANAPKSNLATQAEKSKMMQRMMAQARLHLQNGEGRFQIRLEPPNLGSMRIAIENREGVLSAVITTDNDAARQTLQQNIGGLKAALAEQGVDVGEFDVQVDQQARDQSFTRSKRDRQRRRDQVEKRLVALAERKKEIQQRQDEVDARRGDGLLSLEA